MTRDLRRETGEPDPETRHSADRGVPIQMTSRDIRESDSLREPIQTGAQPRSQKRQRTDSENDNRMINEVARNRDIRSMLRLGTRTSGLGRK